MNSEAPENQSPIFNRRSFLNRSTLAASVLVGSGFKSASGADAKSDSASPIVETTSGKVRGIAQQKLAVFKGISYGESTAGDRRFMPPVKPQPWTGVRDALEVPPKAPQLVATLPAEIEANNSPEAMSEDCLHTNVWTPALGQRVKKPVMVFVHGGGFSNSSSGTAIYEFSNLAQKHDVVVVSMNHRLNVFGYLNVIDLGGGEKYSHSSNVGLQDLVLALEWVRDNVAAFGGDPRNVTLFGESGGGSKIGALLAMPSAKGLFNRAIVQSGPFIKAMPRDRAAAAAEALMKKVGLRRDQVDELQKLPMDQLLKAMQGTRVGGTPMADGRVLPGNPFDPTAPEVSANVPVIIGSNGTESTLFQLPPETLDDDAFHARIMERLHDNAAVDRLIAVYKKAHGSTIEACVSLESDFMMRMASILEAERRAALGKAPTYMYYFTWRSPARDGKLRSPHALEMPFAFDNVDVAKPFTGTGPERQALANQMSNAWANFARNGNPNHKGLPNWPAYTDDRRATMIFDNECKVVNDPGGEERMAFKATGALEAVLNRSIG
jgi:para-nitrobenzyl esterase